MLNCGTAMSRSMNWWNWPNSNKFQWTGNFCQFAKLWVSNKSVNKFVEFTLRRSRCQQSCSLPWWNLQLPKGSRYKVLYFPNFSAAVLFFAVKQLIPDSWQFQEAERLKRQTGKNQHIINDTYIFCGEQIF